MQDFCRSFTNKHGDLAVSAPQVPKKVFIHTMPCRAVRLVFEHSIVLLLLLLLLLLFVFISMNYGCQIPTLAILCLTAIFFSIPAKENCRAFMTTRA